MPEEADGARPISDGLRLDDVIHGLNEDLHDLRAGKISVAQARASAELARQLLRGVHYVIQARRFLEGNAEALPSPPANASEETPQRA